MEFGTFCLLLSMKYEQALGAHQGLLTNVFANDQISILRMKRSQAEPCMIQTAVCTAAARDGHQGASLQCVDEA